MAEPFARYQHKLAERLGYTVRELRERMTMSEFRDWIAHDRMTAQERG